MPKQLNNGKVTQALQRTFGFKGRYNPMLDEVIVPVYQISDPQPAAPQRLAIGSIEQDAPGVGTAISPQFFNPVGSGIIASVTGVQIGASKDTGPGISVPYGVQFMEENLLYLAGPDVLIKRTFFRDQRQSPQTTAGKLALCTLRSNRNLGSIVASNVFARAIIQTGNNFAEMVPATGGEVRQPVLVLQPGRGFIVRTQDATLANAVTVFAMNVQWLEVPILQDDPPGGSPP